MVQSTWNLKIQSRQPRQSNHLCYLFKWSDWRGGRIEEFWQTNENEQNVVLSDDNP